MIRTLNAQIKQLEGEIRTQVRAHPDGPIFLSLFKSPNSVITAAELLAEIGDCRERYPDRDALAADAGQAAVAIESGKWKTAGFRRACNKRLRVAFCRLADSSRHWHPWAADSLRPGPPARSRAPARDPHPRTRLVPSRVAMLAQPHPIRPRRHRALQRHITVTIPTRRARCPTSLPPSGWPARLSPKGGPQAEREALDSPPPSATSSKRLTQDVFGDKSITRGGRGALSQCHEAVGKWGMTAIPFSARGVDVSPRDDRESRPLRRCWRSSGCGA